MRRPLIRRALAVSGLAGLVTLLASARAWAGTDFFSNIAPASPLGSAARFLRYPLSHYGLDQHFTVVSASLTGGIDVSGLLPEIAWFFASLTWLVTSFIAKVVIELFAFAFSLDLVNGSSATGGAGALGPVSAAIHSIYANVFGAPWLVLAFSAVALWAMWKALVQRRYTETAGALALSLLYIVVALFFVAEPGQTIGQASRWTNEMSQAFLSVSSHGSPSGGEAATADDADQLWGLLVERPWSVLEFGGTEHCAVDGTGDEKSDPQSAPVRPLSKDPGQDAALARRLADGTEVAAEGKTCIDNENKYADHFLRFGTGTDERNEEYEALDHGDSSKLPEADDESAGYKLGVADKPATDAMESGGQYQRLLLSLIVAVGEAGAFILLGALAIGVILSQILLLLLLAFSPVALVAAAIPGRGHDFFKAWLEKLGGYLLRKAAYSLVLAVLLAVNSAIGDATSQLGWLFAFGLQAAFFWAVLIQRHTLAGGIVGLATGPRSPGRDLAVDAVALYGGARLGRGALRGVGRAGGSAVSRLRGEDEAEARRPSSGGIRLSSEAVVEAPPPSGTGAEATEQEAAQAEDRSAGTKAETSAPVPDPTPVAPDREGTASRDEHRVEEGADPSSEDDPAPPESPDHAEGAEEGGAGEDPAGREPRRPGAPLPPEGATDRERDEEGPDDEEPRRPGQGGADDEEGAQPGRPPADGPGRGSRPTERPRPEVRDEEEGAGAPDRTPGGTPAPGDPRETGTPRTKDATGEGPNLNEELHAERERVEGPSRAPADGEDTSGSEAAPRTSEEPADPDAPQAPTSPPRRRPGLKRRRA